MKKQNILPLLILAALPFAFSSCEIVGGIFKAGIWVGIISVILVVAIIIWILRKVF